MKNISRRGLKLSCKAAFLSRRFLASNVIIFMSLLLILYFPANTTIEKLFLSLCAYFLLPFAFFSFILKDSAKNYGLWWGKFGVLFNTVVFFGSVCFFLALSWGFLTIFNAKDIFINGTQMLRLQKSFSIFLLIVFILAWFIALKEVFFRGFLLLTWKRFFGIWSLVAHIIIVGSFSFAELSLFNVSHVGMTLFLVVFWSCIASGIAYLTESVFLSFSFSFFSAILALLFSMIFK